MPIADTPPAVETVVVRAARLPPSPADAAFAIIQLPPEILKTAPRLDDALELQPGFSLYRRVSSLGANPTTQGVSLRSIAGSAASRALVTLDGAPQNDPFGGWVIFTSLPPETIGSVDVVLGAGSGPYGAGALTGVVSLESPAPRAGDWLVDGQVGALEWERAAGTGTVALGDTLATFSAAAESSNGWNPIREGRGPADTSLTLGDWTASGRFQRDFGRVVAALRLSAYQEDRSAGTLYAGSRARGEQISLAAEADPTPAQWGWRGQIWALASDLANTSASVSVNQQTASLSDNEFQTPALGLGANAAARKVWSGGTFEIGADTRIDGGEDRETFDNVDGVLTRLRRAGGETFDGGVYAEGTQRSGRLLFAADGRLDDWRTFDGHDIESPSTAPADGVETSYAGRGGVIPSGRAGVRYDLDGFEWLRTAIYAGFRPPTLNELFRSYRVGNNVTKANPDLAPERLYGVEGGAGGSRGPFDWSVTVFYNRLDDPVTNVTLRDGPYTDPVVGFVPAGGALLQRENVGAINAYGVEGRAELKLAARLSLQAAFDWTHARVDGGTAAADLDGLRPAETPSVVVTGLAIWSPLRRVKIIGDLRYEGQRFVDDQNQLPLGAATVADLRAEYAPSSRVTLFIAADNLFNAAVQQNESVAGLYSYGPPRLVSAGVRLAGGP
jgi:outer membrane receptor protein involved in Fe transport